MRLILRDLCGGMRWGLKLRDSPGIVHGPRFNAGIKLLKGLHFFIIILGLTRILDSVSRDNHARSLRSHRIACSFPPIAPCFASCLLLCPIHRLTLDDSRPHDDSLMRVVTGARSGRRDHPLPRPLVASRGGAATPFAPRPEGPASQT
jgi:hypothetical protein